VATAAEPRAILANAVIARRREIAVSIGKRVEIAMVIIGSSFQVTW
jgi:hypothetical protein